jgi:hypothetical protein
MQKSMIKITIILLLSIGLVVSYNFKSIPKTAIEDEPVIKEIKKDLQKEEQKTKTFNISVKTPEFLTYPQTVEQLKKWQIETKELTSVGIYGKSKKGADLYYIRVNSDDKKTKPVALMTSCIHGNEPWAAGITMAYIGNLLDQYGKNKEVTDLVDSRDLYFVPVVSPDSYPISRNVDGVDPNRDFSSSKFPDHKSSPSVAALTDLYWKIRPSAVISGHTFGRLLLIPYGDSYEKSPHEKDYTRIVGRMAEMTGYKKIHCSELYNKPINGTEIDWFYKNGSMAVVIEFGTHQHKPSFDEILSEYKKTKDAISLFIKEAPNVTITVAEEEIDFSKNTGIARSYRKSANGELIPAGQY